MMSHPLPVDIARSLNQQWPCRESQVRQLAGLLSVSFPTSFMAGINQSLSEHNSKTVNMIVLFADLCPAI